MVKYNYMTGMQIFEIIKKNQPSSTFSFWENSYNLLKTTTNELNFTDKKNIYNKAIERALLAAQKGARTEFICAVLFFDLVEKNYLTTKQIRSKINDNTADFVKAYLFSKRKLNNDNINDHAYRTALKLASIKINFPAICAAMLHETPVHSDTKIDEIAENFNKEVAQLVANFLNILTIKTSNNSQYVHHLREMVVAMAKDLRVIIIKMCSNIDRMERYGENYPQHKLIEVATESMEILAPLANILGIWELRWQLEDLAFKILQPEEYKKISKRFDIDEKKNRQKYIQKTIALLYKAAKEANINCSIDGRFKHFYSIYQKMRIKKKSFNDICDVFALRVIVNNIDDCYRMLGIIHGHWRPKKRRVKDYIAAPKTNNYRCLHTTVFGINGRPTEFQIRTQEMDDIANFGIAAHWYYKNPRRKTPEWMQELLIQQQKFQSDEEFISEFSSKILRNRIYAYTPKGDVIALPTGSTPVDFAYAVHTEIGNKCSGAIVNDIKVSLDTVLTTNDVVEIIINRQQAGPNEDWLNFVQTNNAKKHIQEYIDQFPVERQFRL